MDGQWEWSESGDDTGETADLNGDLGYGDGHFGYDNLDGEALDGHDGQDGHDGGGGQDGDDLEEPLGTENAAEAYDQSVHDAAGFETLDTEPGAEHTDTGTDATTGAAGDVYGADPDLTAGSDDPGWHEPQFPAELHLEDPPEPVDGFPWTDADVLGEASGAGYDPAGEEHSDPQPAGLADYAGADLPPGADAWGLLLGSDDPATSTLAGFWAPHTA